jgi:hypothetical protein
MNLFIYAVASKSAVKLKTSQGLRFETKNKRGEKSSNLRFQVPVDCAAELQQRNLV